MSCGDYSCVKQAESYHRSGQQTNHMLNTASSAETSSVIGRVCRLLEVVFNESIWILFEIQVTLHDIIS